MVGATVLVGSRPVGERPSARTGVASASAGDSADLVLDGVRSMVVVGDSITAGGAPVRGPQVDGESSWVPAAIGPQVVFRSGWATGGVTTADMRAAAPMAADVLC